MEISAVVINGIMAIASIVAAIFSYLQAKGARGSMKIAEEHVLAAQQEAGAAERSANVAEGMLQHIQHPVLILRVLDVNDNCINMVIQNIGESAAIWPKVWLKGATNDRHLLDNQDINGKPNPPHILPPRQYWNTDGDIPNCQRFNVPKTTSTEYVLIVQYDDLPKAGTSDDEWLLSTSDDGKSFCVSPKPGWGQRNQPGVC